jgi:Tfp pilus assembly ATPase PilU
MQELYFNPSIQPRLVMKKRGLQIIFGACGAEIYEICLESAVKKKWEK